ncbi:MAG: hypothetical protein UX30_C0012G0008 [Candidatus Saccharibacteria bacterium GW2011_GWA2_46_10]|nr:MAG: hypothetical protein UX30_C0012G0008 [Candidatus Saccharibacteria bacterium GW2011_GWA2_46_10]
MKDSASERIKMIPALLAIIALALTGAMKFSLHLT